MRFSYPLRALGMVLALAPIWAVSAVHGQSLIIEPVSVQLAPGQMAATLTVVNQSDTESSFQVRAYVWQVEEGEDKLSPTDVIALSPPLGTIAPGARQLIRLVLRTPAQGKEDTYRVWLDQIPAASQPGAVRIALRLSIPVFALPATRVAPDLRWRIRRDGEKFFLTAHNAGTRHQAVRNVAASSLGGAVLKIENSRSPYVLPGSTRNWEIVFPEPPAIGAQVRLTAKTGDGVIDQVVTFDPAAP